MKLTEAQLEVLRAMASGHTMVFSQDGDEGWLSPKHHTGLLPLEQTCGLRDLGLIGEDPNYDGEYLRYGPDDVITEAGRALLRAEGETP